MTWNCSYFQFKYLNQSKGGLRCLRVRAHRYETLCDGYCAARLIKISSKSQYSPSKKSKEAAVFWQKGQMCCRDVLACGSFAADSEGVSKKNNWSDRVPTSQKNYHWELLFFSNIHRRTTLQSVKVWKHWMTLFDPLHKERRLDMNSLLSLHWNWIFCWLFFFFFCDYFRSLNCCLCN